MSRYRCTRHDVVAQVDEQHRSASFEVGVRMVGRTPHACWLAMNWPRALDGEEGVLGERGPWHPRRRASACLVVKEGA